MSDPAGPVRLSASLTGAAGAPVLVLGNSVGTTSELWQAQLAALGARFRLLRYEHRGHGGSSAPPGPYTIAGLGADVLALLDEHEIETARYCGLSLGGMVGMWLAAIGDTGRAATLVAQADPGAAGRLRFDIYLQGERETVFFDV